MIVVELVAIAAAAVIGAFGVVAAGAVDPATEGRAMMVLALLIGMALLVVVTLLVVATLAVIAGLMMRSASR